jgi:hypothetical protein
LDLIGLIAWEPIYDNSYPNQSATQ